jgi:acetyl-CoA acetyltransferase
VKGSVVVLGAGLHPWGSWGRGFLEYGAAAARAAVEASGLSLRDVGFLAAAGTVRCGYPGYVAASSLSRALGLREVEAVTVYGACASGAHALAVARDRILAGGCDIALVVGADVARPIDQSDTDGAVLAPKTPDIPYTAWLGLRAARRMHEFDTRAEDLHRVRVKNSAHGALNCNARFRVPLSMRDVERSPVIAAPLRLLHVSTFSDGAAAVVVASQKFARRQSRKHVYIRGLSLSALPDDGIEIPYLSTRSPEPGSVCGRASNIAKTLKESAVPPEDLSVIELYDVSSTSELDWYEHIGLCGLGEAEQVLRSGATALGGRIPVNVSGGLTSFGEAVSAQSLAQVCELTWQLQGRAGARQVVGARTGLAVSDGMYGHAASVALST